MSLRDWILSRLQKPRTFRADDGFSAVDLVRYANDHQVAAKVLFNTHPMTLDNAGYLSCLAVVGFLKALVLHETGEFPGIHDRIRLYRRVLRSGYALELMPEAEVGRVLSKC